MNDDKVPAVKIEALLQQNEAFDMQVYLCIPSEKILAGASIHKGQTYVFKGEDGMVQVPIGVPAFIFAVGSKGDQAFYGITHFTVQANQTISIDIKEKSAEEIKAALIKNKLEGEKIDIQLQEKTITPIPCDIIDSPEKKDKAIAIK